MSENTDSETVGDGNHRDGNGRFVRGNFGGPGAPAGGRQSRFRQRLLASISDEDIDAALRVLRETMADPKAKAADRLAATTILLDRATGKPAPSDPTRIEIAQAPLLAGDDPILGLCPEDRERFRQFLLAEQRQLEIEIAGEKDAGDV